MTLTDFVITVENELGWTPKVSAKTPLWKARSIEAMKLKRAMGQAGVDLSDLQLALAYSKKRHEPCTPTGLCWRVEAAKERSAVVVADVDESAQGAIEWEVQHELDGHERWITRLIRTQGAARAQTLQEWRTERAAHLHAHAA